MRFTLSAQRLTLVRLWLVVLALSRGIPAISQDTAPCEPSEPNCENSRFFQMALLTYPDYYPGINWEDTASYVDIPMFMAETPNGQPPGLSIMLLESWYNIDAPMPIDVSTLPVDWSRILAVHIDEPYMTRLGQGDTGINPCYGGVHEEANQPRRANVGVTRAALIDLAEDVHAIAPRTRVWVNFHYREVDWMRDTACPMDLNDPVFDVVSLDRYEVDFFQGEYALQDEYAWFASTWSQQQVALVPGTHYRACCDNDGQAAARLQGFFEYANSMNQQCETGLGRVGRTGYYDGCRVWIVAGWLASPTNPDPPDQPVYYGLLHPSSDAIADVWLAEFSKVRRSGPRTLSDGELSILLQTLD